MIELLTLALLAAGQNERGFLEAVRPALVRHCGDCHDPSDPDNKIPFLRAKTAADVENDRSVWKSVAAQLRNRTMPPADEPQPSESERMSLADWVEKWLRKTATQGTEYAGPPTTRRLNRREYDRTIHELFGLEMKFSETFPREAGGGEGFDNNGETLFLPPLLLERYLDAAQQVLDAAIVSPPLDVAFPAHEMLPRTNEAGPRTITSKVRASALVSVYVDGVYLAEATVVKPDRRTAVRLIVDGIPAGKLTFSPDGSPSQRVKLRLTRGVHQLTLRALKDSTVRFVRLTVKQEGEPASDVKRALHESLLGTRAGEPIAEPRHEARRFLGRFLPKAFRRPVDQKEIDRFMALYDRAAQRGDPYEEAVKLALKGVLASPSFLFLIEAEPKDPGVQPLSNHELASRLSYFLWTGPPDETLRQLADQGRLQDDKVLAAQVDRMLDDPKSSLFLETFIGQWWGTRDVGGRVAPTLNSIQKFYTPEVASDMRAEAVLLFEHIVRENRSLLELINADYTFLTRRLAKFYRMPTKGLNDAKPRRVHLTDGRRGGALGLGAVLAMTSHEKESSPVLRGAWVLDVLLGTPVPTPPPGIPPLRKDNQSRKLPMRQALEKHREFKTCAACHNLIDPIGFGLENFDQLGRWRDTLNGKPVDAKGKLPSGETFDGPDELREVLLRRKQDFARQVTRKLLGYALGRSLVDKDDCVIERLVVRAEKDDYRARDLIRAVILSTPFRKKQRQSLKRE